MQDPVGKLIAGRFRVLDELGSGGIGSVYRAIQEPLEREVALKMLRPELSESLEIRRRFAREARAVAALSHPNIAMVHDFGIGKDRTLFMAMELVPGPSLADLLATDALTWPELAHLFDQILTGLAHAHARGIIHRDIKPANILVSRQEDGTPLVKIVDFGIAAVAGFTWSDEDRATGIGQVVGTPQYMAPEQARGERHVSATVDVYATGLMLFRAVTGHEAFDGENPMDILVAQVHNPPPPVIYRPGLDVPPAIRDLIADALRKSPRERIPSASAFRTRLRAASDRHTPAALTPRTTAARPAAAPGTLVEEAATVEFAAVLGGGPAPLPPSPSFRGELPFVGREDDLARVVEACTTAAAARRGLIVLVEAEAGAGKSRVVAAARDHLVEHAGFQAAHGAFHREGERGLRGIREAFEELIGARRGDQPASAARIQAQLADWGVVDEAEQRAMHALFRTSADGSRREATLEPDALAETLLRVLETAAGVAPVVLTIDDVQWAGRETETLLDFLASNLATRDIPVFVLCTFLSGETISGASDRLSARLGRFDGVSVLRMTLRPLTDAAAHRLLAAILPTTPELAASLVQRAAGNPMCLVQLARYLAEEHLIEPTPAGWQARRDVDVSAILPPSLADVMQLRIDQLDALAPGSRLKELLNRCAVLGRSFRFSVLERMLQVENRVDLLETIDTDIDLLLEEEYLLMTRAHHDDLLTFPNSLIRDALNARMRNRRTTRRLHAFAAEAKLAILGRDTDAFADELVRHFAEACDPAREFEYACVAANVAERGYRPHDAVTFLGRCVALLTDEPELSGTDEASRHEIRLRVARLLVGLGEYQDADGHFAAVADEVPPDSTQRVLALLGRAEIARTQGSFTPSRALYAEALDRARQRADIALMAQVLVGLAGLEWHTGNMDAAEALADQALAAADQTSESALRAEAIWLSGDLARSRGAFTSATEKFDQAMALFTSAEDRHGIAKCYARRAVAHRAQNNLEAAEADYERARDLYASLGERKGVAQQLNGLGDVARFRGQRERAADLYRRAVDTFQALLLPYDAAIALTNLGLVAVDDGRFGEAEDAFRRALAVAERIGYAYLTIGVGLNLAHVLVRLEREAEAHEVLEQSLALADRSEMVDPDFARPLERIADMLASSGERAEAREMLLRARAMWSELGRGSDMARVDAQLARTPA